ncbi:MAG TPA: DUF5131 family protein, partial [Pseudonocardiaceae bacterium]|nr:DUF5131 family protein [Pseudonocardiaceae bacterium]
PRHTYQVLTKRSVRVRRLAGQLPWSPNVWMGVSVENSGVAGRIEDLRQVPAAVRFLSCEPLLGPLAELELSGIGWVIAGGESGPDARPPNPRWFTDLRDQCLGAGVPFFFKQWGGATPKAGGRMLQGRTWDEMPPVHPGQLDHQPGVQNDHHGPPPVDHQRSVVRPVVRGVQPVQNDHVQPVQGVQSWTPDPDQVGHPDRTDLDTPRREGGLRRALSPRDRALVLADLQRRRTGALPSIRDLTASAEVAHGTAATVLHQLRESPATPVPGPAGLHLVTDQDIEGPEA